VLEQAVIRGTGIIDWNGNHTRKNYGYQEDKINYTEFNISLPTNLQRILNWSDGSAPIATFHND
jgi:hypothetical protein